MVIIPFEVSDEESELICDYVNRNSLDLSEFIRDTVLARIKENLSVDEEEI